MPGIGQVTSLAKQRTALPWPNQPYAGTPQQPSAPGSSYATPPTTPPSTVANALANTTGTIDQAKGAINATQPFLDQYLKPNAAGTTPFRQALTNTKASTTADAYDNAVARTREKAQASGFASNPQPVTFGAEAGIANERAKAIADIPNQVNLEAQPVEFQAAGMQQNQAGIYNALANTQDTQAQILAQQQAARDAQKAGLTGALAGAGITAIAPILAHAAGVGGAAAGTAGTVAGTAGTTAGTAAAGGAGAGGGIGSTLGALATNPITLIAAGTIGGALLLNHFVGQGRKAADKLTGEGGIQHAFEDTLKQIDASGDTPEAKWQEKTNAYNQLVKLGTQFAQQNSHDHLVATQMFDEISHLFGQQNPLRAA
jgi:hypothetical protein